MRAILALLVSTCLGSAQDGPNYPVYARAALSSSGAHRCGDHVRRIFAHTILLANDGTSISSAWSADQTAMTVLKSPEEMVRAPETGKTCTLRR